MKNDTIFVDTGAWYALADKSDAFHRKAASIFPRLLRKYHHLTTTNLVIAETYILLRRALGHQQAIAFLQNVSASPRIVKLYSDATLENMAEAILRQYEDQDFSYTDAVSFAVMKRYGVSHAFSFDKHFVTAGFTLAP